MTREGSIVSHATGETTQINGKSIYPIGQRRRVHRCHGALLIGQGGFNHRLRSRSEGGVSRSVSLSHFVHSLERLFLFCTMAKPLRFALYFFAPARCCCSRGSRRARAVLTAGRGPGPRQSRPATRRAPPEKIPRRSQSIAHLTQRLSSFVIAASNAITATGQNPKSKCVYCEWQVSRVQAWPFSVLRVYFKWILNNCLE